MTDTRQTAAITLARGYLVEAADLLPHRSDAYTAAARGLEALLTAHPAPASGPETLDITANAMGWRVCEGCPDTLKCEAQGCQWPSGATIAACDPPVSDPTRVLAYLREQVDTAVGAEQERLARIHATVGEILAAPAIELAPLLRRVLTPHTIACVTADCQDALDGTPGLSDFLRILQEA